MGLFCRCDLTEVLTKLSGSPHPLFPREKVEYCQLLGSFFIYKKNFAYIPALADEKDNFFGDSWLKTGRCFIVQKSGL
jgi:hypothetical protein